MKTIVRAAVMVLLAGPWAVSTADGQTLFYKANGNEPVIFFTRLHHRVIDVQDHQEVSVYADGRVRVHTPGYMKNPGTFEYRLSGKAMQSLLGKLEARGLMAFDVEAARAARDSAAAARSAQTGERFHVSDLTATQISLNFASFGKNGAEGKAVRKEIVWKDLPADAMRFPSVDMLTNLAEAERLLLRLTDHSRRNAVRVAGGP